MKLKGIQNVAMLLLTPLTLSFRPIYILLWENVYDGDTHMEK